MVYFVPAVLRCGVLARGIFKKTQNRAAFGRHHHSIRSQHSCNISCDKTHMREQQNYIWEVQTTPTDRQPIRILSIVPIDTTHTTANRPIPHSTGANRFSRNSRPHCPERKQARSLRFDYECTFNSSFSNALESIRHTNRPAAIRRHEMKPNSYTETKKKQKEEVLIGLNVQQQPQQEQI